MHGGGTVRVMEDVEQRDSAGGEVCAGCGARIWQDGLACEHCWCLRSDPSGEIELAPRLRRLAAYLIDALGPAVVALTVALALTGGVGVDQPGASLADMEPGGADVDQSEASSTGMEPGGAEADQSEASSTDMEAGGAEADQSEASSTDMEAGGAEADQPEASLTDLDGLLISLVVLGAALLAWTWSAGGGQSPGMRMLGLYVHRTWGGKASAPLVILRDLWLLALNLLFALIGFLLGDSVDGATTTAATAVGLAYIFSAAWVLRQRDRRALHDFVFDTVVVQRRRRVLGVPLGQPRHGYPAPPGELPPDR